MYTLKKLSFCLIVSFMALLTAACKDNGAKNSDKSNTKPKDKVSKAIPVEAVALTTGEISSYIQTYANIEAQNAVEVNARIAELVKILHVEEGDKVSKGDLLVTLQNDEQRIALSKIRSTLEKNQNDLKRQEHLKKSNLVSGKDYANAKDLVKQSLLDKERAQLNYDYTFVRAPINGTVTERHVNIGNNIKVNDPLFSLVDFDSLIARIYLPQDALSKIKESQKARLETDSLEDTVFHGEVLRISPIIDPRSGTFKVTIGITPAPFIRPGMYVKVSLKIDEKLNAVLIPKKALVVSNDQTYIYRVERDRAVRVPVQASLSDIDFVTVDSGIYAGDQIIIAGQNNLKDKAKIRVIDNTGKDGKTDNDKQEKSKKSTIKKELTSQDTDLYTDTSKGNTSHVFKDAPVKQPNESRSDFKKRMRDYTQSLSEVDRKAFVAQRKKQRELRQQEAR